MCVLFNLASDVMWSHHWREEMGILRKLAVLLMKRRAIIKATRLSILPSRARSVGQTPDF